MDDTKLILVVSELPGGEIRCELQGDYTGSAHQLGQLYGAAARFIRDLAVARCNQLAGISDMGAEEFREGMRLAMNAADGEQHCQDEIREVLCG